MKNIDHKVDDYIDKSADFAKPILKHLRTIVHRAEPNIIENIKWGIPSFELNGIVCLMAGFKAHCFFGFHKEALMTDPDKILGNASKNIVGQIGQLKSVKDIPKDEILIKYIKRAIELNQEDSKLAKTTASKLKAKLVVPVDLEEALATSKKAKKIFDEFSYTNKKEYIDWINDSRTDETRDRRIETSLEWIKEGKPRNWKYMK